MNNYLQALEKLPSLKAANGSEITIYETTDKLTGEAVIRVQHIKLVDVILSYQKLTAPEITNTGKEYTAELIIKDEETWNLVLAYLDFTYRVSFPQGYKGKTEFRWSIKEPKQDDQLAEGAFGILSVKTYRQPKFYNRAEDTGYVTEVNPDTEDLEMLIYSGMVAEAFVTMGHWSNNHGAGIRPYINAICRTGEGTRFGTFATYDYQSAFGTPSPEGPVATPSITPSITPTTSVTPNITPSVTPATPTPTPTTSVTPNITPSVSNPTVTPTPTPSDTQTTPPAGNTTLASLLKGRK